MSGAVAVPALPVAFAGQASWLKRFARDEAIRLFDDHGWRHGWIPAAQIAQAMWPDLAPSTRGNYLRALLAYLVAEGKATGEPQVLVRHGKLAFSIGEAVSS